MSGTSGSGCYELGCHLTNTNLSNNFIHFRIFWVSLNALINQIDNIKAVQNTFLLGRRK